MVVGLNEHVIYRILHTDMAGRCQAEIFKISTHA
jgi:hypothetical protein